MSVSRETLYAIRASNMRNRKAIEHTQELRNTEMYLELDMSGKTAWKEYDVADDIPGGLEPDDCIYSCGVLSARPIARYDVVDPDSGEILLERGNTYSKFHVQVLETIEAGHLERVENRWRRVLEIVDETGRFPREGI